MRALENNNRRAPWSRPLLALLVMGAVGTHATKLHAQGDAWVVGDQYVKTAPNGGVYLIADLPSHPYNGLDDHLEYHGDIPQHSQAGRVDENGDLLLFLIDGSVYDKNGYLIAPGEPNNHWSFQDKIPVGATELLIVPVPMSCSMFYVLSFEEYASLPQPKVRLLLSIVDVSAENPLFPPNSGHYGRWLHEQDLWNDPQYAQFSPWLFSATTRVGEYQWILPGNSDNLKSENMFLDAFDPQWPSGDILVHATSPDQVNQYKFASNGVYFNWSHNYFGQIANHTQHPANSAAFGRDQLTNEILFGFTSRSSYSIVDLDGTSTGINNIGVMRLDPANGSLIDVDGYDIGLVNPGPNDGAFGVAFDLTGELVYFTMAGTTFDIGMLNRTTEVISDVTSFPNVTIPSPASKVYTAIEPLQAPNGTGSALAFGHAGGIAVLVAPENPTLATWIDALSTSNPINTIPVWAGGSFSAPVLMNASVVNDQYIPTLLSEGCCIYRATDDSYAGPYSYTGFIGYSNAWEPNSNGLGNAGTEVIFDQDYVLQTGSRLYVKDMVWRFMPGKRLILEPGAKAYFYNSTLTSIQCEGQRWRGAEVRGNWSQGITAPSQARLTLSNCTVSNAEYGVLCSKWNGTNFDISGDGGAVRAHGSTFKNNLYGATMFAYQPNGGGLQSLNYFSNCDFITDTDWPDPGVNNPKAHLLMWAVNHIGIYGCSFANNATGLFAVGARGTGVYAVNAGFSINGADPNEHYMHNLAFGVYASTSNPALVYKVEGMDFQNNWYGILDLGSTDPEIHSNTFTALNELWTTPSVQLYLYQTEGYSVEQNIFHGAPGSPTPSMGVYFYGPTYMDNRIYDNEFHDLWVGCEVEGKHLGPSSTPNTLPGLQLLCGDHTDNTFDQAILLGGVIRENQGESWGGAEKLANNQYFGTANCSGTWDIWVDVDEVPCPVGDFCVQYFFYDHSGSSQMRPECVDGTHVDDVYDLIDFTESDPFDKEIYCNDGDLDDSDDMFVVKQSNYRDAVNALVSAIDAYNGVVDGGEKPDLIEAIQFADPWHASYYLRDIMLAQHPLSDEVMTEALYREVAMDQWHLTQVLIDNSPLGKRFHYEVIESEKLNPFFLGLLQQAQDPETGMSTRQVLEMEVSIRHERKDRMRHRLLAALAMDSIVDPLDSLIGWLQSDPSPTAVRDLYRLYTKQGMESEAGELLTRLEEDGISNGIMQLGAAELSVGGDWLSAEGQPIDELWNLKEGDDQQGKGEAWAILHLLGETEEVPTAILPGGERSAAAWAPSTNDVVIDFTLQVFPNPVSTTAWFTLPEGFAYGTLELLDAQGRLILQLPVTGIIAEADLRALDNGLYLARLLFEGLQVVETKFTISR